MNEWPASVEPPDPPFVRPAVEGLAQIMGRYSQGLLQILPHPPYTASQLNQALEHIQAAKGEILQYERQLEQANPGSTSQPKVAAWVAYHQQTLEQAENIYGAILRSVSTAPTAPPFSPGMPGTDPQERMRRLLGGCCIHCGEYLGGNLYRVAICPRCGLYPTT
jgi:hypothetical protein